MKTIVYLCRNKKEMEIPLYQKHIIEAIRAGCKIWMDDFGKTTYHIKIGKSIKKICEPTIETLIYRGLLKREGKNLVLTEYGTNGILTYPGKEFKTTYSI